MTTHISESYDEGADGWWSAVCGCGWSMNGLSDLETVVDALMEHAYEAGFVDGTHQDHPPEPGTQP